MKNTKGCKNFCSLCLYVLKSRSHKKKGKLLISHRYNLLTLLRSRPGEIQRELVVQDLPDCKSTTKTLNRASIMRKKRKKILTLLFNLRKDSKINAKRNQRFSSQKRPELKQRIIFLKSRKNFLNLRFVFLFLCFMKTKLLL